MITNYTTRAIDCPEEEALQPKTRGAEAEHHAQVTPRRLAACGPGSPHGSRDFARPRQARHGTHAAVHGSQKKCHKKRGDARIELATSCTLSKNHTTRPITQPWRSTGKAPT